LVENGEHPTPSLDPRHITDWRFPGLYWPLHEFNLGIPWDSVGVSQKRIVNSIKNVPLYYTEIAGPCGSNLSDLDESYELPLKYFQSVSDDVMQYGFVLEYILTQSQAHSESKEDCIHEQQGIIARHRFNKSKINATEFLNHGFNYSKISYLKFRVKRRS